MRAAYAARMALVMDAAIGEELRSFPLKLFLLNFYT
jgi:hypothetical protein